MSKYFCVPLLCSFVVFLASVQAVPEGRILNGIPAMKRQFPFVVSLRNNGTHICGGTIITKNYVLTAAHCVGILRRGKYYVLTANFFTVYAGSINRLKNGVEVPVAAVIPHENYEDFENDIGLVKLAEPLKYQKTIQPARLGNSRSWEHFVVAGWGSKGTNARMAKRLQWTVLWPAKNAVCQQIMHNLYGRLTCLKPIKSRGTCTYDAGSPAIDQNNNLVGVKSFRIGTCEQNRPRIFTLVEYYMGWIIKNSDL